MKLKEYKDSGDNRAYIGQAFWCPACDRPHMLPTEAPAGRVKSKTCSDWAQWAWNGSDENATFEPSVLSRTGHYCTDNPKAAECGMCIESEAAGEPSLCSICHSFVRDGQIQFLGDCTHSLAGKTVPLPEYP